jgi:hypothetical protein
MSEFALENIDHDGPAFAGKRYHNPIRRRRVKHRCSLA